MTAPLHEDMRITVLRCPGCGAEAHAARAFDPIAGPPPTGVLVSTAPGHTRVGRLDDRAAQLCPKHGLWLPHRDAPHVHADLCAEAARLCDRASALLTEHTEVELPTDIPGIGVAAVVGPELAAVLDEAAAGWRRCANVANDGLPTTLAADPLLRRVFALARAFVAATGV